MRQFAKNCKFLRSQAGLTQAEIGHRLGFSRSTWNNYENDTSTPNVDDLIHMSKFFGISESDLLHKNLSRERDLIFDAVTGKFKQKGDLKHDIRRDLTSENTGKSQFLSVVDESPTVYHRMPQVVTVDTQGNENVIMVPVRARAGYLNGYADPEFISHLPGYRLPGLNTGSFRMFEVEGLSMYPTLNSGDIVIGAFVEQWPLLRDDRVHVFVTKNEGIVVKRVLNRLNKDGKFILKSDNYKERDIYPNLVLGPDDVLEIWYAFGFISRNMKPPAEMYNRLIDIEGRLSLLEEKSRK